MLACDKVPPVNEITVLWQFQSNKRFFHKHIWTLNINCNRYVHILLGWQVPVLDSSDTTCSEPACESVHRHCLPPAAPHLQLSLYILTHITRVINLMLCVHKINCIHLHTHHTHTHTHRKLINTLTAILNISYHPSAFNDSP